MDGRPIVVADDDPTVRDAIATSLELQGYPVRTAPNGREALQWIEAERPSLVLLDLHMPVLDGWHFSAELKARGFDPPVIIMSHSADARLAAKTLGASGYLDKPFAIQELLAAVRHWRLP
jgi:DNA-binding response OmpR family regulator